MQNVLRKTPTKIYASSAGSTVGCSTTDKIQSIQVHVSAWFNFKSFRLTQEFSGGRSPCSNINPTQIIHLNPSIIRYHLSLVSQIMKAPKINSAQGKIQAALLNQSQPGKWSDCIMVPCGNKQKNAVLVCQLTHNL